MFKQLESKTSKNTSFSLISIYFQFAYQHNIYQSILAIVKAASIMKRSFLQRIQFTVTEFYILELIEGEFKIVNSKEEVNYSKFIESNQMQQNLDWLFEDTASDIVSFWKLFREESGNVQKAYVLGLNISKNIKQIREYTVKLEDSGMIKDYNKYYYYAMFYQNLLNDRQSYNQMISNIKNTLLMRNMRKKNSRFGQILDINDIGFAILSFEDDKTVGKFKYANKVICTLLNVSEEDILDKSVNYIMPELVRINHEQFTKRFIDEGLPRFIGRVRSVFVKDFQEYIHPSQFFMNFYYNSKFSYSLILHLDPITAINYYNTTQVIPIKHVMIFLCDSLNTIMNISSTTKKLIGLSKRTLKVQEEIMGRKLRMDDIIFQIGRLEQVISENNQQFITNQIVKVKSFNNQDSNYVTCSLQYEELVYLKNYPGQFKERVYFIIPISKVPEYDNSSLISSFNKESSMMSNQQISMQENFLIGNSSEASQDLQLFNEEQYGSFSQSQSSKSSSTMSNSSTLSYTKGLLFSQKSPKILKVYLYIVFGVLFSFLTVSSINFIIFIQKKNLVNQQIEFNQLINQRNTYLTTTISNLKILHLISIENQTSNPNINVSKIFTENRYAYYRNRVVENSQKLLNYHEQFKTLAQRYDNLGASTQSDQYTHIPLYYLSRNYNPYLQNNSLDYGLSLLVSNIGMVTDKDLFSQKVPINLQEAIKKSQNSNQTASDLFRNLYYIFQNGMGQLNYLGAVQEQTIQSNTIKTSDESKLYINLMSFISIGIITLIGIFTFPLLGKIEDRKISVLKFFNLLNSEQIQDLISRGQEFQEEFNNLQRDQNQNKDRNQDYENDYYDEEESEDEIYQNANTKSTYFKKNEGVSDLDKIQVAVEKSISPKIEKNQGNQQADLNDEDNTKFPESTGKSRVKFREDLKVENNKAGPYQNEDAYNLSFKPQAHTKLAKRKVNNNIRKDSNSKNASMTEIHKIFLKIQKNQQQQTVLSDIRRQRQNEKNVSGVKIGPSAQDMKLAFEMKRDNMGRSVMQRIEEESKENDVIKIQPKGINKNIMNKQESMMPTNSRIKIGTKDKKGRDRKRQRLAFEDIKERRKESEQDSSQSHNSDNFEKKKKKYQVNEETNFKSMTSRSEYIQTQLEKIALKEKLKLALYVLIVLIFLNSNLFASFYIGQQTFSEDSRALFNLATFYHKENYLDNLLFYSQEQFIQNNSIVIKGINDSAEYYLNRSQQNEQEYNDLRKGLPTFLQEVSEQLENIESSALCSTIYKLNITRKNLCENVYDQIMKRGLTSTIYMILTYSQQLTVRFQKEDRTQQFLIDRIRDQKLKDITDLYYEYLHDSLDYLENLVTQTALSYFDSLSQYYLIIYGVYMGVAIMMCFFFGFFVFKKLKEQIMTSTNILAIILLEDLDHRDRIKIESFLNS